MFSYKSAVLLVAFFALVSALPIGTDMITDQVKNVEGTVKGAGLPIDLSILELLFAIISELPLDSLVPAVPGLPDAGGLPSMPTVPSLPGGLPAVPDVSGIVSGLTGGSSPALPNVGNIIPTIPDLGQVIPSVPANPAV